MVHSLQSKPAASHFSSTDNGRSEESGAAGAVHQAYRGVRRLCKYRYWTIIKKITSNEHYILFNYDYDDLYDGAIRDDLTILLPNDVLDIANQEMFINEVNIEFLNSALLYNNAEYNFILKPLVLGVENNKSYNESVSPSISSGNVVLNNDIFISGTEISKPGNYELTINGINNYSEIYNFTIVSNMTGITNNHTYLEPVTVSFSGEGYLNNQFIDSPAEVSETGEYILKIKGENNVPKPKVKPCNKPCKRLCA